MYTNTDKYGSSMKQAENAESGNTVMEPAGMAIEENSSTEQRAPKYKRLTCKRRVEALECQGWQEIKKFITDCSMFRPIVRFRSKHP